MCGLSIAATNAPATWQYQWRSIAAQISGALVYQAAMNGLPCSTHSTVFLAVSNWFCTRGMCRWFISPGTSWRSFRMAS